MCFLCVASATHFLLFGGEKMSAVFSVKSSANGQVMNVYEDKIELTQKGFIGLLSQGLSGTKTYYYKDITTVQFKNCGWTAGFFEFTFAGGIDKKGGLFAGADNDNRFVFGKATIGNAKKLAAEMEKVNEYIQERLRESKNPQIMQQNVSSANEIEKYNELFNKGIITEEEYVAKKKQLLGL